MNMVQVQKDEKFIDIRAVLNNLKSEDIKNYLKELIIKLNEDNCFSDEEKIFVNNSFDILVQYLRLGGKVSINLKELDSNSVYDLIYRTCHQEYFMSSLSAGAGYLSYLSAAGSYGFVDYALSATLGVASATTFVVPYLAKEVSNMNEYKNNRLRKVEKEVDYWLRFKYGKENKYYDASLRRMDGYNRSMAAYLRSITFSEYARNDVRIGLIAMLNGLMAIIKEVVTFKWDCSSKGLNEKARGLQRNIYKMFVGGKGHNSINKDNRAAIEDYVHCYDVFNSYNLTQYLEYLADEKIKHFSNNNISGIVNVNERLKSLKESLSDNRILLSIRKIHYAGLIKSVNNLLSSNTIEGSIEHKGKIKYNNDIEFKSSLVDYMIGEKDLLENLNFDLDNNGDVINLSKIISMLIKSKSRNEFNEWLIKQKDVGLLSDDAVVDLRSFSKKLFEKIDDLEEIRSHSFDDLGSKPSKEQFELIDDFVDGVLAKHYRSFKKK